MRDISQRSTGQYPSLRNIKEVPYENRRRSRLLTTIEAANSISKRMENLLENTQNQTGKAIQKN